MSQASINLAGYVVLTVMGMYFLARHKRLGVRAQQFQREKFHIHVHENWYRVGYFIGGMLFVIFGLLEILKILKL